MIKKAAQKLGCEVLENAEAAAGEAKRILGKLYCATKTRLMMWR